MSLCPCGSNNVFDECCAPLLSGEKNALTAEQLMRARYCAFVEADINFLGQTIHPDGRKDHDAEATRRWAANSDWLGLEIVSTEQGEEGDEQGVVEFIATFKEKGVTRHHHERSRFLREKGNWYFVDGDLVLPKTQVKEGPKVGRNEPCPCGSGRKFKKCCGR
ncbi:MAG: YchJ family protein [Candidatus Sedimenticola sp. (ex Thyasira tokunagai)]